MNYSSIVHCKLEIGFRTTYILASKWAQQPLRGLRSRLGFDQSSVDSDTKLRAEKILRIQSTESGAIGLRTPDTQLLSKMYSISCRMMAHTPNGLPLWGANHIWGSRFLFFPSLRSR